MISKSSKRRGFTLLETVIAIGVLAVLLTAFLGVFGPATAGIRRAVSQQEADRLSSTLERELVTLRPGQQSSSLVTGFDKAYQWIEDSMGSNQIMFIYQYRGNLSGIRTDGTLEAYAGKNGVPGKDYTLVPMLRRRDDPLLKEDLASLEGRVFAVKAKQLVFSNNQLTVSTSQRIEDPTPGADPTGTVAPNGSGAAGRYPEAVIAFSAEFYNLPTTDANYLTGSAFDPVKLKTPVFTRNLAVRR